MIKNFYMFTNCSNSCPFYVKYILYNKAIASENLLNPSHQITAFMYIFQLYK